MTALADQLAALGLFPSAATADLAITAGHVYKDGNGQIRVAGGSRAIVADRNSAASQVAAMQSEPAGSVRGRSSGSNKW